MSSPLARVIVALALSAVTPAAVRAAPEPAPEVRALLARADAFRQATAAVQVDTRIQVWKGGALDKERDYRVFVKPDRRSLVLSRSAVEKGQKVLMVGDDFWIVLPTSQRPIRITPAQKLLGDASTGDIATLTWAEDYTGALAGQEDVGGVPCDRLELTAARKGVTYARITLFLARADAHPVSVGNRNASALGTPSWISWSIRANSEESTPGTFRTTCAIAALSGAFLTLAIVMGEFTITYTGKIEGQAMSGTTAFSRGGAGEWKAERIQP